jgi:hypothetical protein
MLFQISESIKKIWSHIEILFGNIGALHGNKMTLILLCSKAHGQSIKVFRFPGYKRQL